MKKEINVWWALLPIVVMIIAMMITIIVLKQEPHMPLLIGTSVAAFVAWKHKFKWKEIEEMMMKGIKLALPAVIIIMLVGLIIGSWIGGGIISTMIFYGLKIMNPTYFLVTISIICAIVSLVTGTSWGTMGTVGVAGLGIGLSMGIPAAMIVGAIISGAYFGDKMSPLSDTTNLAAGLTHTDLFVHIKNMFYTTIPGLVIALIVYYFLGKNYGVTTSNMQDINQVITVLQNEFIISTWLLLVPVAVLILVIFKLPAVPVLSLGVYIVFLMQIIVQGDSISSTVNVLQSGYVLETNNEMVNELLNSGGLDSMMFTVSLVIVAMTFGGILEYSGILDSLVQQLLKVVKSTGGLIASTLGTSFFTNVTCSEQYISIVVPSRMFVQAYKDKGLHSKNLSRALEDG